MQEEKQQADEMENVSDQEGYAREKPDTYHTERHDHTHTDYTGNEEQVHAEAGEKEQVEAAGEKEQREAAEAAQSG